MHSLHLSEIRKSPLVLDSVLHSWNWSREHVIMAGGTGAIHLSKGQLEWRGDPKITRGFLDFLKVGFKKKILYINSFGEKKTLQYRSHKQDSGT